MALARNVSGSLDAFLAETLRMCPPAPFATRLVVEPLELGKTTVPPGWLVIYGVGGSQLDAWRGLRPMTTYPL